MKKLLYRSLLAVAALGAMTSCNDEDIIFDYEYPQFETKADAMLLEVVVPTTTSADDRLYITGEFNGWEDAVGNPMWQLEKARDTDAKWGIYLRPETFAEGKTLADGYLITSATQGIERTLHNEDVLRTDNPTLGSRTTITVERWKQYFDKPVNPDEITHDGYVIYVVDNSGFEELAMYAWGDAEAFGGWPGIGVTGSVTKDGTTFKYFDTGDANKGMNLNLIFNNNGNGSQLGDYNVTLDKDFYLELTPEGVVEYDPSSAIEHDGYAVFVVNLTGWADADLRCYMWGTVNDLNGGWPGMAATGSVTIKGTNYLYFDMGASSEGYNENLIFSNNGESQLSDFAFTIDRDIYLEISGNGVTEIDPENYNQGEVVEPEPAPEPEPDPEGTYKIYFENLTSWAQLAVYAWGDSEPFGGWPGVILTDLNTVTVGSRSFIAVEVGATATVRNFIMHDNAGTQYDAIGLTIDHDIYLSVTETSTVELDPATL